MNLALRRAVAPLVATSVSLGMLLTAGTAGASGETARTAPAGQLPAVPYSVTLSDQLLAELHFLPVNFVPVIRRPKPVATTTTSTTTTTVLPFGTTTTTIKKSAIRRPTHAAKPALPALLSLRQGHYVWRFPALPAAFRSQWSVGTLNVILQGAIMRFQDVVVEVVVEVVVDGVVVDVVVPTMVVVAVGDVVVVVVVVEAYGRFAPAMAGCTRNNEPVRRVPTNA